jgi:hypothetical protein
MITWNYRVFREEDGNFIIREVFYDENKNIVGCTQDAVEPFGKSLEALAEDLAFYQEALAMPVLTLADIPACQDKKKPLERGISLEQVRLELGLDVAEVK